MDKVYTVIDFGNYDHTDGFPSGRVLYKTLSETRASYIKETLKKNFPKADFGFEVLEEEIGISNLESANQDDICNWYTEKFLNKKK